MSRAMGRFWLWIVIALIAFVTGDDAAFGVCIVAANVWLAADYVAGRTP